MKVLAPIILGGAGLFFLLAMGDACLLQYVRIYVAEKEVFFFRRKTCYLILSIQAERPISTQPQSDFFQLLLRRRRYLCQGGKTRLCPNFSRKGFTALFKNICENQHYLYKDGEPPALENFLAAAAPLK